MNMNQKNELTFSIIKPNAIKKNAIGAIINQFEKANLKIVAAKFCQISRNQCEEFYAEHKQKPFFEDVVKFMTSSPVMLMVLSGDNAVDKNREIMGATDPSKASPGSIRALWGDSIGENAIHGSDSKDSAKREIEIFFSTSDIFKN